MRYGNKSIRLDGARERAPDREETLRIWVMVILSLGVAAQIAQIARSFHQPVPQTTAAFGAPPRASARARGGDRVDVERIVNAHLFGLSESAQNIDPPAMPSSWVLNGTILVQGFDPHRGWAIIGENADAARLRAVGDEIGERSRLSQVFADHVTVDTPAGRRVVRLPQFAAASSRAPNAAPAKGGAAFASGGAQSQGNPPPALVRFGNAAANRPPAMVALKPQPYLDADGHYGGMRVMGPGNGDGLATLGLERNDVITEIEGRPISSPDEARRAMELLSQGSTTMVTVQRNGHAERLPLTISSAGP